MTVAGQKLTAYELQVLIGTTISGCSMSPDRTFDLPAAWARLRELDLHATDAGVKLVASILTELQHRTEAEAGAPEGWVLVPRKATDAMLQAAADQLFGGGAEGSTMWDAMLAASPSSPASGVRVKALEWVQLTSHREDGPPEPIAEWEATCLAGIYSISDEGGEWFLSLATIMDVIPHLGRSSDPDALRAVAQSDFAGRILSALGEHP